MRPGEMRERAHEGRWRRREAWTRYCAGSVEMYLVWAGQIVFKNGELKGCAH